MTDEATTSPDPGARVLPGHAHTVVVPLSNPDTANDLLVLASMVTKPEGGRVIGLVVVLGEADAEANLERIEALEEMVQTVRARDGRVKMELLARPATSVARGILDVARDEGADMVILGVQAPTPGGVTVGALTQQVVETADCDVLIYRRGAQGQGLENVDGVVVGLNRSDEARVATRLGALIGDHLHDQTELLHVLMPGETEAEGRQLITDVASGIEAAGDCTHRVVQAGDVAAGLRGRVPKDKLTIFGFSATREGTSGISNTTRLLLDTVRGPVLAISRPQRRAGVVGFAERMITMLRPRLTDVEEQALVWYARLNSTLSTDFIVLCVVSSVIATLGLLLNSAAVIIGAMLVAPLMSPLVAFGTALVDGEVTVLRRSAVTVGVGSALVAGTAILLGLLISPDTATTEMLSRGSPSLVDAGVAAASGVIGGYASARKGIPAALAGVAIAAALVPPICVFGLAITLDGRLAAGAGLLFVTNIACIAAASAGVLVWLGVHVRRPPESRARYMRLTAPVLVAVLITVVLFGLAASGPDLGSVQAIVEDAIPDAEVMGVDTLGESGTVTVTIRAPGAPSGAAVQSAVARVEEESGLRLRIATQTLLEGAD